jgi:hypothetical protein
MRDYHFNKDSTISKIFLTHLLFKGRAQEWDPPIRLLLQELPPPNFKTPKQLSQKFDLTTTLYNFWGR